MASWKNGRTSRFFDRPGKVIAQTDSGPQPEPDDCSVKFGLERFEKSLFIAIRVIDDTVSLAGAPAAWNQDGLHIWISTFPMGNCDDDPLFALIPGSTAEDGYFIPIEKPPPDLRSACLVTDTGYDCEIAVPIAYLETEWQSEGGVGALEQLRFNIAAV